MALQTRVLGFKSKVISQCKNLSPTCTQYFRVTSQYTELILTCVQYFRVASQYAALVPSCA